MDAISEARLQTVHPELARRVRAAVATLPVECRVTQALRTSAEQAALYAQGRSAPGKIVTNARAGESWHNFGLAVDLVPSIAGTEKFTPDWGTAHPIWKDLIKAAQAQGLRSGIAWNDVPHVEYTGIYGAKPPAKLLTVLSTEGLAAVWKLAFPGV